MKKALLLSALITISLPLKAISEFSLGEIDRNNDRAISKQELLDHRAGLFDRFDLDKNGLLSEAEHKALMAEQKAQRQAAFEKSGSSKGGFFKKQAEKRAARAMDKSFGGSKADINGDGQLSKDEFLNAALTWFSKADRNKDGQIDRRDRKS